MTTSTTSSAATTPAIEADLSLLDQFMATEVTCKWLGVTGALTPEEKARAAASLGDPNIRAFSASKRLYNPRNPYLKRLNSLRTSLRAFWYEVSLAWVKPGVRLIKVSDKTLFEQTMDEFQCKIIDAGDEFGANWPEIKQDSREFLKDLFHEEDYPATGYGLFQVLVDYPNLMPPPHLDPVRAEAILKRRLSELDQSIAAFEASLGDTLNELIEHLVESLRPAPDGTKKAFYASTVTNFQGFFERVKRLSIRDNTAVHGLIKQAEALLQDVDPNVLRVSKDHVKEKLAGSMVELGEALAGAVTLKKRRSIELPSQVKSTSVPLPPDTPAAPSSILVPGTSDESGGAGSLSDTLVPTSGVA